ncbi:tripartite tricarboxylate transporter substrate binding protein [Roseomonas terrae]|uniref:Tripartite tricarboxylate transporter substrate binding protein n=2 Tax=Neoroseomonas terrae TaxID=424799 RepID=A0ABS5EM11_9PROT|nr:tripartite tricarboxylate transporter substrate binding protein [Neoroseomonas terrae]
MPQSYARRALLGGFGLGLALATPARANDDAYPTRPVRLVVGFPPGGPTDVIGRMIAGSLSKELGVPVVIENLGGAGGTIGATNVVRSAPDGYSLLMSVEASQTRARALYPATRYDQVTSFTFIRKLAVQRNLLVVHPGLRITSVAELIAYARAHPGELNFPGTVGASGHIGGTIFNRLNSTEMTFVSYSGGSRLMTDLMTGTVQVGFFSESTVAEMVRAGRVRALAVASLRRSPAFPDLPTIEEAGGGRVDASPWFGLVGPAGLPPAVTRRLVEAADRMAASDEFRAQLETIGASPIADSTPETFRRDVEQESTIWTAWAEEHRAQLQ